MRSAPITIASALCLSVVLSACGDKPQSMGGSRADTAAFQGAENRYVLPGWKAGDRASWEQSLKTRAQTTQNEYTKTNAANATK